MDEGNWQSVPTILSGVVVGWLVGSISAVSRVRSLRAHFPEQRLVIEPRWLVIAIIPHNSFYFTLFSLLCISVPSTTEVTTVKGLRTRLKLRCFPEQFIPHYSIYVGTSHSGCALPRLLKLWLDKSVLAACRRGSECTVLFVGLCVRAALVRNMSPNIFLCLGTSWFCLCVLLLCLRVLCRGFARSSLWHDLFQVYDWKTSCPCTILRITSNFSPISPFLSGHWVILFISFLDNKDINKEIPHPLYWQPAFSGLNI